MISPGAGPQGFYVYEHWRPDTGLPFYVGKGRGKRADFFNKDRNERHRRIVAKLNGMGLRHEVRRIFTGLDEEMAFLLERSQISYWRTRGVDLANMTPGGEGSAGYKWTEEQCARSRGMRSAPEFRAQLSLRAKEASARPEVKARHAAAVRAAFSSPEIRQKMRDGWAQWRKDQLISPRELPKKSEEELAKHRAVCKARMAQPDVMEKHRASLKEAWARTHDDRVAAMAKPETKAKHRAAVKAAWDRRRGIGT